MTDPTTPTPPATEGQAGSGELALLVSLLNDVYTDEGVFIWLYSVNRNLDGRTPFDLWVNGDRQKVMREAHRISDRPDAQPTAPAPDTAEVQTMARELHTLLRNGKATPYADGETKRYYELVVTRWLEKLSKSDTASVLAGLREEMTAVANAWGRNNMPTEASAMRHAIALVEAAQARLADPVRGGGAG